MDLSKDYLLICVDAAKTCAIRFVRLNSVVHESLELHKPQGFLPGVLSDFLIAGTLLGSRQDEQQSLLFKLQLGEKGLRINCEVASAGLLRAAIFPADDKILIDKRLNGSLKVVTLKRDNDVYESMVEIKNASVQDAVGYYLDKSVQSESLLLIHSDPGGARNYGLWIEKLPGTSAAVWDAFTGPLRSGERFLQSFAATDDPDRIVSHLFPDAVRILAVTHPRLTCSCDRERILRSLRILPQEDLVEIFLEGKGMEARCDYCQRLWRVTDEEIKALLDVKPMLH